MTTKRQYDIDALLEEVVTLPSLPQSLERILKLLDDPSCPLREVAKAISSDPSIALKTLRLVNSAYYGLGQQVTSVEHAVVLLGVKVIKNLVLTATVFNTIGNAADRFLRHSIGCAVAMRSFAEGGPLAAQVSGADEAFVYGLLHDIGKVILGEFLPDEYAKIQVTARESGLPWFRVEREVIGADHAEVGARLAERWKLAPNIVNAIAGHHDLTRSGAEDPISAATLAVADYLCSTAGLAGHENPGFDLPDAVWAATRLTNAGIVAIANRFFDAQHSIDELIKLAG